MLIGGGDDFGGGEEEQDRIVASLEEVLGLDGRGSGLFPSWRLRFWVRELGDVDLYGYIVVALLQSEKVLGL